MTEGMKCSVDGCGASVYTRGRCAKHAKQCQGDDARCKGKVVSKNFCSKHYTRWRKHGDPNVVGLPGTSKFSPEDRFKAKYLVDPATHCWLWTGALNSNGLPVFSYKGKAVLAYRWAYEQDVAAIPQDHFIHRMCEQNECVNPKHLELRSNDPADRFWSRVKKLPEDGCWLWKSSGFTYRIGDKAHSPRRYAWEQMFGPTEENIHSLCGRSKCIRPDHCGTSRDKFWAKVNKTDECWYWTGSLTKSGYPHLTYEGKSVYAYRLSWEWSGGTIEEGYVLAHTCKAVACVRPEHLETLTYSQSAKRRETNKLVSV